MSTLVRSGHGRTALAAALVAACAFVAWAGAGGSWAAAAGAGADAAGAGAMSAGTQAGLVSGLADQGTGFFGDPLFQAIDLTHVRVDVPWDAGLQSGWWDAWLAQAHAAGYDVLLALDHDASSRCPGSPCAPIPVSAYAASLQALLARYPWLDEIEPWNEPNDQTEPTYGRPDVAADYYNAAAQVCPSCTLVAGDMLDDARLASYLRAYAAALQTTPTVWGLHNYYDATYFQNDGVDTMLADTGGELWLSETGGLVSDGDLPVDPARAGQSVTWLYDLAATRPRITRMYLYDWRAQPGPAGAFDSALLNADGTPRPSYEVLAAEVGPRPAPATAGAPASPGAAPEGAGAEPQVAGAGSGGAGADSGGAVAPSGDAGTRDPGAAGAVRGAAAVAEPSGHPPLKISRAGAVAVRLACAAPRGSSCRGVLRLRAPGGRRRSRRFVVAGGQIATVRLTPALAHAAALRAAPWTVRLTVCTRTACVAAA